jgi:hypothetical protein
MTDLVDGDNKSPFVNESGVPNAAPSVRLPSVKQIVLTALLSCLPFIGIACILCKTKFAIGMLVGSLFSAVLYLFLRSFVSRSLSLIAPLAGRGGKNAGRGAFAVIAVGKFIVIGGLLLIILWKPLVDVPGFFTGFLISQVGVTIMGVNFLKHFGA